MAIILLCVVNFVLWVELKCLIQDFQSIQDLIRALYCLEHKKNGIYASEILNNYKEYVENNIEYREEK